MKKLLTVLLLICLIVSVLPVTAFANTGTEDTNEEQYSAPLEDSTEQSADNYISLYEYKSHYLPDEMIEVSFLLTSELEIEDIDYVNIGFSAVEINVDEDNEKKLNVVLDCLSNQRYSSLELGVVLSNGETVYSEIYAFNNEYGTFISYFSDENARDKYYQFAIENGILTTEQVTELILEETKGTAEEIVVDELSLTDMSMSASSMSTTGTYTIAVTLMWVDDNNVMHPLRKVWVEAYSNDMVPTLLTAKTMENDGTVDFEIPAETEVFFKVYAGDSNAMVKIPGLNIDYCYPTASVPGKEAGERSTLNVYFHMDTDFGKAAQISQAVLTARDYAWDMMDTQPNNITIVYPYDVILFEEIAPNYRGNCFYLIALNSIFITCKYVKKPGHPDTYSDWDAIMHEYGHHIQENLEISDSPGRNHFIDVDMSQHFISHYLSNNFSSCLCDSNLESEMNCVLKTNLFPSVVIPENQCKYKGAALAWSEAWAMIFGNMAQEYYSDYLSNIQFVNDAKCTSFNDIDISYRYKYYYLTESLEMNIQALLYDMYDDDVTTESFDCVCFSHEEMWNFTTHDQVKTLYEFIELVKNTSMSYIERSNLGKLLHKYNLTTTAPDLIVNGLDCPTVQFEWNEPNPSGFYNARKFSVNFYNSSCELVGSTTPQEVTLNNSIGEITIDETLWQSILNLNNRFYLSVTQREYDGDVNNEGDDYFITGYESEYTICYPSTLGLYESIAYNSVVTKTLDEGECYWFKFTAPSTDVYVFETGGETDTYGELFSSLAAGTSNTNMLTFNDDGGEEYNFKITYALNTGESVYLRVRGYGWDQNGEFTLSVSSNSHVHNYVESYSRYNANAHKAYCYCGEYIIESHDYIFKLGKNTCKHCGYATDGPVQEIMGLVDNGTMTCCDQIYCLIHEEDE